MEWKFAIALHENRAERVNQVTRVNEFISKSFSFEFFNYFLITNILWAMPVLLPVLPCCPCYAVARVTLFCQCYPVTRVILLPELPCCQSYPVARVNLLPVLPSCQCHPVTQQLTWLTLRLPSNFIFAPIYMKFGLYMQHIFLHHIIKHAGNTYKHTQVIGEKHIDLYCIQFHIVFNL